MINQSASLIGTIVFANGNRTTLHVGANSNTGSAILWQQQDGHRPSRVTGRNIERLLDELDHVLCEGEGKWEGEPNTVALDALCDQVNFVPRSARVQ